MTSSVNSANNDVLPPGHPAGTDAPISAGAVLSGRGQQAGGGSLSPMTMSEGGQSPSAPMEGQRPSDEVSSPTVLVAVEDDDVSVRALRVAHKLFGDGARYLAINVGEGRYTSMRWAFVYPVSFPGMWYPPAWTDDQPSGVVHAGDRAAALAESVAEEAGMQLTAVGDVGDPATAIVDAAHEHAVDVVVIGSHERGWFSRMFSGSVEHDLMCTGNFSLLIVK